MGKRVRCVSRRRQNARILAAAMIVFSSCVLAALDTFGASTLVTADPQTPEAFLRMFFQANAERDLPTVEKLVAKDADMVGYTIGGRKYVGWSELARALREEFESVTRLEIPITELHVWTQGDTAWYAMEIDYIRYVGSGKDQTRTVLPMRETGVLERRSGKWLLVSWHESLRDANPVPQPLGVSIDAGEGPAHNRLDSRPDLSGEWEIQEEDKTYRAVLDATGNGTYTWQNGKLVTTKIQGGHWEGTWHQPGNDREGGFEVLLSEDHTRAQGVWWYTRVGDRTNIPPRQWGGSYTLKRSGLTQLPALGESHDHSALISTSNASDSRVLTLLGQPKATHTVEGNTVTITFGPVDLPTGHDMHTAANMPWHVFELSRDMSLIGFKSAVFTKDGKALPRQYLHHISVLNMNRESPYCQGMTYLVAGSGIEMYAARFPAGYGVKLAKGTKLIAVMAFYHNVPPTKDVMASFTMEMAPEGTPVQPMEAHNASISVDCYGKWDVKKAKDETDEGITLQPGVQVRTVPVKFQMDGCVKFAYPHGHDYLVLFTLENKTAQRTLLRTMPAAAPDGTLLGFPVQQVYADGAGFAVNTRDEYEVTMIYHRPLHDPGPRYGMANYLMYMTPGDCQTLASH